MFAEFQIKVYVKDLNPEKAITMCRAAETVKTQTKSESCKVNAVRRDKRGAVRKESATPDIKKETKSGHRDVQGKT